MKIDKAIEEDREKLGWGGWLFVSTFLLIGVGLILSLTFMWVISLLHLWGVASENLAQNWGVLETIGTPLFGTVFWLTIWGAVLIPIWFCYIKTTIRLISEERHK